MNLSRDLREVEAIFEDCLFSSSQGYWFSYKGKFGSIYHFFDDRIILPNESESIYFNNIESAHLVVPNVRSASGCAVKLTGSSGEILLPIDTVSNEKYLDVFPLQKAIARHLLMSK